MRKGGDGIPELFKSIVAAGAEETFSPSDVTAPPAVQAEDVFKQIGAFLAERSLGWKDVVRTWFYLDDIFSWYADFNKVRTAVFAANGVVIPPASTGIGLKTGPGAIRAGILLAPEGWKSVESPLQIPATNYRSSFSRAAEASGMLYVSGTASILPGSSEVAFPGDFTAQTDCALRAVGAILESRKTSWDKVVRAVAYVKNEENMEEARKRIIRLGLNPDVLFCLKADVCRDEWLFELEVDARIG